MAEVQRVTGDVRITGDLTVNGTIPTVSRDDLAQDDTQVYSIPPTEWRKHDDLSSPLPNAAAGDDLGVEGTFGTGPPIITSGDLKATGDTTRYARAAVPLPPEYQDGETATIRVSVGMETNAADTSATVDIECYRSDRENGISADLCSTGSQDCNDTTYANYDFTVTPTSLTAGDMLDIRIALQVNDAATGTEVKAVAGAVEVLCDIKG